MIGIAVDILKGIGHRQNARKRPVSILVAVEQNRVARLCSTGRLSPIQQFCGKTRRCYGGSTHSGGLKKTTAGQHTGRILLQKESSISHLVFSSWPKPHTKLFFALMCPPPKLSILSS